MNKKKEIKKVIEKSIEHPVDDLIEPKQDIPQIISDNNQVEKKSYFEKRLISLEITDIRNSISVRNHHDNKPYNSKFFTEDSEGNIVIHYYTPDGFPLLHNGKDEYTRKRLKNPSDKIKYFQEKGTGVHPFLTSLVISSYQKSNKFDTLIVTEGEFKAIALNNIGLYAIGIGGIFSFKDKEENTLNHNIINIIERCNVKNLILLFDADCLSVEWEENKDLFKRLNQFYNAVLSFNEMSKCLNIDVYFSHVNEIHEKNAKGIDDLIYHKDTNKDELIKEINNLTSGSNRNYIKCLLISGTSNYIIKKYFSVDKVESFYEKYKSKLEGRDFKYKDENWYTDDTGKLRISWYNEAVNYIRVGITFYRKAYIENAHGENEMSLLEWNIGEIMRDYKKSQLFVEQIQKFVAFCNIPEHSDKYKRIIEVSKEGTKTQLYNRYHPIKHDIKEGSFATIEKFLKHIFNFCNTKNENLYEFGLDYIQLLYSMPLQRLPVICLVSQERNTGKSTFLEFLRLIFKENCTILDNERFTGKFTSHFTDKLVIGLDEGFIPVEQKLMKERIKNMSTGRRAWLEAKGKNAQEIDYFGKLILCSNDEKNFMQIDDGENRFAVIKVRKLEYDDPLILNKLKSEIGCFLYFIKNRKFHYEGGKSRFWFNTSVYMTPAMSDVVERTKPQFQRDFEDFIKEHFLKFKKEYLHYTLTDIINIFKLERNNNYSNSQKIKDFLNDGGKAKKINTIKRYKIYSILDDSFSGQFTVANESKTGTPYEFYFKDWLSDDELKGFYNTDFEIEN